jgi:adenosylcobyric acid synthase
MAEHDVVVIEGAGSPAEINLADVRHRQPARGRACDAACLLVTDIDRGGAFAHLYGTWALLPAPDRRAHPGFRAEQVPRRPSLLAPGPQMLQDAPACRPWPRCRCGGARSAGGRRAVRRTRPCGRRRHPTGRRAGVPAHQQPGRIPAARQLPGVRCCGCAAGRLDRLGPGDWIVLPGSKSTSADLAWLRARAWTARWLRMRRAVRRCWGSAAACRCWARR